MGDEWKKRWDERYSAEDFAYGEEPNEYLKKQLSNIQPGKILFAAEGEGRNAVFAARNGWDVHAFDISEQGKIKAQQLAAKHGVNIHYQVGLLPDLPYNEQEFDVIALIYAHFPANIKSAYHKRLAKLLKKGGTMIFEAFSKNHLAYLEQNNKVGGPKEIDMLFSTEELQSDFQGFQFAELKEEVIELHEGRFHNGKGSVIRMIAISN